MSTKVIVDVDSSIISEAHKDDELVEIVWYPNTDYSTSSNTTSDTDSDTTDSTSISNGLLKTEAIYVVDTIRDLRQLDEVYPYVYPTGYHNKSDGVFEGKIFTFVYGSTKEDNGGTVIRPDLLSSQGAYELGYNSVINVKWFGAYGNGIDDDILTINTALNVIKDKAHTVYFPNGEYYISDTLQIQTNQELKGEATAKFYDIFISGTDILSTDDEKVWKFKYVNMDETTMKLFISGDQIFIRNSTIDANNGPHEVKYVDLDEECIYFIHSDYLNAEEDVDNTNLYSKIPFPLGGSVLRFRSLDGNITDDKAFIKTEGIDNFKLTNIGFIGAGINRASGSSIRIYRDDSGAMEGYQWKNVTFFDIPDTAITIESPINSTFENIRVKKCAFDFMYLVSKNGSAMTSTVFRNIYTTSCRRGIVFDIGVYNLFDSCVFEGTAIGIQGKLANSNTFNSISTETCKYREERGGNGSSIVIERGYGNVFNSPSIIYNSEIDCYIKNAISIIGKGYSNLPSAIINGGRIHNSISTKKELLAIEQKDNTKIYYINKSLQTLTDGYWKIGRQVSISNFHTEDTEKLNRHFISDMYTTDYNKRLHDTYNKVTNDNPPTEDDIDYDLGTVWQITDTDNSDNTWILYRKSNNKALWVLEANSTMVEIKEYYSNDQDFTTNDGNKAASKIGRNAAVDITTSNIYRVYKSEYNDTDKKLYLYLDLEDLIPRLFLHKLHLGDGYGNYSPISALCRSWYISTIDDINYMKIGFVAPSVIKDSDDFDWRSDRVVDNTSNEVGIEAYYLATLKGAIRVPSKTQWVKDTEKLYFYYDKEDIMKIGDVITLGSSMYGMFNGTYTISNIEDIVYTKNIAKTKDMIVLKVSIDLDLNTGYDITVDDELAYWYSSKLSQDNNALVMLNGNPSYRVFSQNLDNIVRQENRELTKILYSGESTKDFILLNTDWYNFYIVYTSTGEKVTVSKKDTNTITLSRDDDSSTVNVIIRVNKKINLPFIGIDDEGTIE